MKGFLGGICAGVVVGVIGLAVGLSLVPARDHEAMRRADRSAVVEPETIFDEDPDIAPVDQAQDGGEVLFAPADDPMDVPAATLSEGVEQDPEVGGAVAPAPYSPEEVPAQEPAARPAAVVNAAELRRDAASEEMGPETAEVPRADEDPAEGLPPPAAQILAPRAPASGAVQMERPDLTIAPAGEGSRDGAETQPAALTEPEADLAPPDFDGGSPTPRQPLTEGDSAWADDDKRPALVRNAVGAPPSWAAPLLAVVVVDRAGTDPIEGVPVSVAIAADAEDAQARAEAWRAAGAEIVAIPGLPAGAAGTGPLALFGATFDTLPQAATIMAGSAQGSAGGPVAADEIAATLAETGHGLILRSGTPAPFAQAAERAGVPTVEIFRRVDGSGRDGRAVGRFLDQAAFEARNRGAVVVIADNSPETAEGLARFLESARADSVALVPVSAILRAQ